MARRYGPCENILISGCILHSRDSALKVGTETYGIIRNVILILLRNTTLSIEEI